MKIKENEKRDTNTPTLPENYKVIEHEGDGDANCNWYTWNGPNGLINMLEELGIGERAESIQTKHGQVRSEY